jgi:hypothetical protein
MTGSKHAGDTQVGGLCVSAAFRPIRIDRGAKRRSLGDVTPDWPQLAAKAPEGG